MLCCEDYRECRHLFWLLMHILFIFYEHVAYSNLNTNKNIIVLNRLQALGLDESYFVLFFSDVVAILQDHYNQTTQIPLDLIHQHFVKRFRGLGDTFNAIHLSVSW